MNAKKLGNKLGAWAFVRLQKWMERKSPLQAEISGAKLGRFAFKLSKRHRARALENLTRAFPEMAASERLKVAQGVLEHFGRVMADFLRSNVRSNEEALASTEVVGREHFDEALKLGRGILLVSGHFGNWERMSHWISASGYPVSVVARDANDPEMNKLVVELRNACGAKVISRGDAVRPILERLRGNELVGILPDQNSGEIFVPFFGHLCGTVKGPGTLALRTKSPVIPVYCVRVGPARYQMVICPPLEPEPGFEPIEGMTRAINRSLEEQIRRYPEQYLWIHNRWKSAKAQGLIT
ncbi:MAG: lysophospholipid acyltransferase family protein [Fimbriimonadaceae bacterium]